MKYSILRCLSFIMCLAIAFSLFACEGKTDGTTTGGNESAENQTEESSNGEGSSADSEEGTEGETEFVIPELEVEETEGSANVSTSIGLSYTVKGYDRISKGKLTFTKGLEFSFSEDTFAEKFNRFTMYYSSDAPVRIYVTYTDHRGEAAVADYFVEKGEGSFSAVIPEYIDKKTATSITKLVVDTCENKQADFTLHHLSAEKAKVFVGGYGSTKYYIKNDRFELGVDMSWGGAICHVADLTCPIQGLENLVNKADEGRLIQQSYYGTSAIPGVYEPGEFNNSKWNYNPVQGGDKYGNDSRIIDVVATENSIYIKAQPQDWSLNGAITPSYMENTYVLHDDYIEVKNRFVDFSGWTHPVTTQEIPAFYTVSYLDSFVWYNGTDSWTNDTLSYRGDLNFWGDPLYRGDCTFPMRQSNDETWCAWINSENNYGLGVYVPNADIFLAGRVSYNGTMNPDHGPCGYVAPLKKLKLVSYEALEYSYLLTTGSVEDIRATFKENKDFTENECLDKNSVSMRIQDGDLDLEHLDFTKKEYCDVFTNHNSVITDLDTAQNALKVTVTGMDPYAAIRFADSQKEYQAGDYTTIEIVYMIPTTNSLGYYDMELFLSTGDVKTAQGGKSVRRELITDGEYHTLSINVSSVSFWNGKINEIRVDFFGGSNAGDVIYVKSITLK